MIIASDPPLAVRRDLVDAVNDIGHGEAAEYLTNHVGSTLNVTIPRQRVVLDYGAPTEQIPKVQDPEPEPGELSPLNGEHRIGVAKSIPFAKLLPLLDMDYDWEPHPWARGRHNFPMRGVGWAIAFAFAIAALALWLILSLHHYAEGELQVPAQLQFGAPNPPTTGQTPTPPRLEN